MASSVLYDGVLWIVMGLRKAGRLPHVHLQPLWAYSQLIECQRKLEGDLSGH